MYVVYTHIHMHIHIRMHMYFMFHVNLVSKDLEVIDKAISYFSTIRESLEKLKIVKGSNSNHT